MTEVAKTIAMTIARRRRHLAATLATAFLVCGVGTACTSAPPAPPTPAERKVVWRDSFDGHPGSAPNAASWSTEVGGDGWGNQELEYYTPGAANARLDGAGHLVITADRNPATSRLTCWYGPCSYVSARLVTEHKVTIQRGRVEARIKVPRGSGLWPAFWLLGDNRDVVGYPDCGEIDVLEVVGAEGTESWASAHGPGYVRAGLTRAYTLPGGAPFSDDFHTYAVEMTGSALVFSVDGTDYYEVHRDDIGERGPWVFDKPFYIVLNLAVGGDWPGTPAKDAAFPAEMLIDYVTIYEGN